MPLDAVLATSDLSIPASEHRCDQRPIHGYIFDVGTLSSLPGWQMPASQDGSPDAGHVIDYLTRYEQRYDLPMQRPVRVHAVTGNPGELCGATDRANWYAHAVVSATGTWSRPYVPFLPGQDSFNGTQEHSAFYSGPEAYAGQRVGDWTGPASATLIGVGQWAGAAVDQLTWTFRAQSDGKSPFIARTR